MKQSVFVIGNMDCPTEEALIRKRLASVPGIGELAFNLMERRLTVDHTLPDEQPILGALREIDGVAHAEAHAEMGGAEDFHGQGWIQRFVRFFEINFALQSMRLHRFAIVQT